MNKPRCSPTLHDHWHFCFFSSWQWILTKAANDYGKQGLARYNYIHLPLQYKGGDKITNEFFMKFEECCQMRNYKQIPSDLQRKTYTFLFKSSYSRKVIHQYKDQGYLHGNIS